MLEWCLDTPRGKVCIAVSLLTLLALAMNPKVQRRLGLR